MVKGVLTACVLWSLVPTPQAAASTVADAKLLRSIRTDLESRSKGSFDPLFARWASQYGTRAVPPLLKLASERRRTDADRYVALMGASRLGGPDVAPVIARYLGDRSWMIRGGALRALRALGNPATGPAVLPLLRDPALVVRSEAIETVRKLHPSGTEQALIGVLEDMRNYRAGKALWVPLDAIRALVAVKATAFAPRLRPLLGHTQDPTLQTHTVAALEALTGRSLAPGTSLAVQVRAWEVALASPAP